MLRTPQTGDRASAAEDRLKVMQSQDQQTRDLRQPRIGRPSEVTIFGEITEVLAGGGVPRYKWKLVYCDPSTIDPTYADSLLLGDNEDMPYFFEANRGAADDPSYSVGDRVLIHVILTANGACFVVDSLPIGDALGEATGIALMTYGCIDYTTTGNVTVTLDARDWRHRNMRGGLNWDEEVVSNPFDKGVAGQWRLEAAAAGNIPLLVDDAAQADQWRFWIDGDDGGKLKVTTVRVAGTTELGYWFEATPPFGPCSLIEPCEHCDTDATPATFTVEVKTNITACGAEDHTCITGVPVTLTQVSACGWQGTHTCGGFVWTYNVLITSPTTYTLAITYLDGIFIKVVFCYTGTFTSGECADISDLGITNDNVIGDCGLAPSCSASPTHGHGGTADIVANV